MKRFSIDLENGLEYILETDFDDRQEQQFGKLFCDTIDGMSNKATYIKLFNSGMIEDLGNINNDDVYRRFATLYNYVDYETGRKLFMEGIKLEYHVFANQLLPFYPLDNEMVMKVYFNLFLTEQANIRKCEHCGKYFIFAGNYNSIFCDRYCDDRGHTCKQIGPFKKQRRKMKDNPVLDAYRKAYNRQNMARARGKLTEEQFSIWRDRAKITLELIKKDEISMEDYFDFMKQFSSRKG